MEEKTITAKKPVRKLGRKKVCAFCVEKAEKIDYKDIANTLPKRAKCCPDV